MFGTMMAQGLERTGEFQRFLQASALGEVEQTFCQTENSCRVLGNLRRNLHCTLQKFFRPRHFAHQTDAQAIASVDHTSRESQLQGFGEPYDPREQESPSIPGINPTDTKVSPKRAFSLAIRMSHMQVRSQPAPMAGPFTAAMAGTSSLWKARVILWIPLR